MNKHDIDKSYVSPYDKFLYAFDETHEKSESQLAEIKKHQRIAELRDNPDATLADDAIWTGF